MPAFNMRTLSGRFLTRNAAAAALMELQRPPRPSEGSKTGLVSPFGQVWLFRLAAPRALLKHLGGLFYTARTHMAR